MKINYSWLQSHFDEKLPKPEKLAELLTMHSQEVESVEEKDGDYIFDVKVLPNRNFDFVDYQGAIRDISAILKIDPKKEMLKKAEGFTREAPVKETDMEKILGVKISQSEIEDFLTRLGFVIKKTGDTMFVFIPDFRQDISTKEDIAEEIGRIYGYDKIEPIIPEGLLVPPKRNNILFFSNIARKILTGIGFSEVYNYSFAKSGDWELQNPPAKDKGFLRTNLIIGLENNVKENSKHSKNIKVFEIGKIFPKSGEVISLGAINNKTDFYEMKGAVDAILEGLGMSDFYYQESAKKTADIRVGNTDIGVVDHNHFELNFEELARLANETVEYSPISKYPAIVRDVAIFVPLNEKVDSVLDVIENTAGKFLVDTDLFDIYENDERKSLAFHLIFQSPEKTLTDDEVNVIMQKIFEAIETKLSWEVRR